MSWDERGWGKCFLSGRKTKLQGDFKLQNHLLWSVSFCSNLVLISKLTHFKIVQNLLFLSYEKYVKDCHHLRLFKSFSNRTNKPHILGKGEDWFLLVINKYLHTYTHIDTHRQAGSFQIVLKEKTLTIWTCVLREIQINAV